jgi:hypothetical protein
MQDQTRTTLFEGRRQWGLVLLAVIGFGPALAAGPAPLAVAGGKLVDPDGRPVILRGVSSMGMAMVYGDKDRPGTYLPMTPEQYIDRALQTDATGNRWYSNAIRLNFERFPSVNPTRLYRTENSPYAMPDTIVFVAWQAGRAYADGDVVSWKGSRYRVVTKLWRGDRGLPWNPDPYRVGDIVVNIEGNVYRCTSSTGSSAPAADWGRFPRGTGEAIPEDQGGVSYVWQYIGKFGQSGTEPPFDKKQIKQDNRQDWFIDGLVQWQYMSPDYSEKQALANFDHWKSKVMDPVVKRAIDRGLYVVIADFDFGPAHHPLRRARMLDFWKRMASSQWANHPQVLFELWNESEDIGSYRGGPGSWAEQKPAIQETVDAVRAAGARNVIIVPTPFYSTWAGEATASPLTGPNLAYAIHQYRSQWEMYPSNREQILQGLASGQAMIVTEWGDNSGEADPTKMWPNVTSAPPSLRQLLEPGEGAKHPAVGWFAWALSNTWEPHLFRNAALTQPTPFGIATRQWLFDKRPDPQPAPAPRVSPAFDPAMLAFALFGAVVHCQRMRRT